MCLLFSSISLVAGSRSPCLIFLKIVILTIVVACSFPPQAHDCLSCVPFPFRYAQELLREAGVSLVLNLKPELLERLARCLGTKVRVWLETRG
jgi:hypothetical protein